MFGKGSVKQDDICRFFRIIRRYNNAGVSLMNAVEEYKKNVEKESMQKIVNMISREMANGSSFADALKNHSAFPAYAVEHIRVGEETGKIPEILDRIVETMTQNIEIRRDINNGLKPVYFFIVGFIAAILIALLVVIPKTKELMSNIDINLPWVTQLVLDFGEICQNHWVVLLMIALGLVMFFLHMKKNYPEKVEEVQLKLPFIGKIYRNQLHYRFCKIFALCQKANINTKTALQYTAIAIGNLRLKTALINTAKSIENTGIPLVDALRKEDRTEILEKDIFFILRTGVNSGTLDRILDEEAEEYRKKIASAAKTIGDDVGMSVITPLTILLLIFLGTIIGAPMMSILEGLSKYAY